MDAPGNSLSRGGGRIGAAPPLGAIGLIGRAAAIYRLFPAIEFSRPDSVSQRAPPRGARDGNTLRRKKARGNAPLEARA